MTRYCVVNCCPGKAGIGVSFYGFPRDDKQREGWVEFVRRSGRPDDWLPRKRSLVCSLHFEADCYNRNPEYLAMFGLSKRNLLLNPGALPTIHVGSTAFKSAMLRHLSPAVYSGAESVVPDCTAVDSVKLAVEPTSSGSPVVPAPCGRPPNGTLAPFRFRGVAVQTQCHVEVAMKCQQVDIKLRTQSRGVQTGDANKAERDAGLPRRRALPTVAAAERGWRRDTSRRGPPFVVHLTAATNTRRIPGRKHP